MQLGCVNPLEWAGRIYRKNYKTAIELSDKAISHWSMNMKAHYRKCKSLMMLRRFENCIDACEAAIKLGN